MSSKQADRRRFLKNGAAMAGLTMGGVQFAKGQTTASQGEQDLHAYGEVVDCDEGRVTLRVPKAETAHITERLLADLPVIDLLVEDPPIEEVIDRVFTQEPA